MSTRSSKTNSTMVKEEKEIDLQPAAKDTNDDDTKTEQAKGEAQKQKSMEDLAQEFFVFLADCKKKMNKKDLIFIKQQIVTKAMQFYRRLVEYLQNKAKPDILEAKKYSEMRAKAFARQIIVLVKQINAENMILTQQLVQGKAKELISTAMKFMTDPNYRNLVVKREMQQDQLQKHGRMMLALLSVLMVASVGFGGSVDSGSLMFEDQGGVRGRSLMALKRMPPSPMSLKPSPHSLHPKWKLWEDMNAGQQKKALAELGPYFQKYGSLIGSFWNKLHLKEDEICPLVEKKDFGGNELCEVSSRVSCNFLSIGMTGEGDFERNLGDKFKCRGFVTDPIQSKQSKLGPTVSFQNLAMTKLRPTNSEKPVWNTSIPVIRQVLGLEQSDVLKLTCEGCEIALTRDVLTQDPSFFHRFNQVSTKKHASKAFVESDEELYYFGLMFPLLEEAGHLLVSSNVVGCRGQHEKPGCRSEFQEWGYHCGNGGDESNKIHRSCQHFLFAKEEIAIRSPDTTAKAEA